jgi:hypothetical protein
MFFSPSVIQVEIGWNNVGKQIAQRGTADLFTFNEGRRSGRKLGVSPIDRIVTNIPPGFGATSDFNVENQNIREFSLLVCTKYFGDGDLAYEQAFLFRRLPGSTENAGQLEELPRPDSNECRQAD